MTLDPRARKNLEADLAKILGFTDLRGVRWPNVLLAQQRARDWQSVTTPPHDSERGGSSSPTEQAERLEDRRVARQASRDAEHLPRLLEALTAELVLARYDGLTPQLAKVAEDLARVVARCVDVVDHANLPGPPGCKSCARTSTKKKITGHFSPISDRYKSRSLCDQCGRYAAANFGQWPPIEFVDILARQGKQAAGRWLARRQRKISA